MNITRIIKCSPNTSARICTQIKFPANEPQQTDVSINATELTQQSSTVLLHVTWL